MIQFSKPNKWELLSLLVDAPSNAAQEKRILEGMSGLERASLLALKHTHQPLDKEQMRRILTKAGAGELRVLEEEQVTCAEPDCVRTDICIEG
jgi:hypothetical protein